MYKLKSLILISVLFLFPSTKIADSQTLPGTIYIVMTGLKNAAGPVQCNLFNSKKTWLKNPYKIEKAIIKNGKASCKFTAVDPGTYAISAFHDENKNGILDHALIFKYPLEGYCISNNPSTTFGAPSFKDAAFLHNKAMTGMPCKFNYW